MKNCHGFGNSKMWPKTIFSWIVRKKRIWKQFHCEENDFFPNFMFQIDWYLGKKSLRLSTVFFTVKLVSFIWESGAILQREFQFSKSSRSCTWMELSVLRFFNIFVSVHSLFPKYRCHKYGNATGTHFNCKWLFNAFIIHMSIWPRIDIPKGETIETFETNVQFQ